MRPGLLLCLAVIPIFSNACVSNHSQVISGPVPCSAPDCNSTVTDLQKIADRIIQINNLNLKVELVMVDTGVDAETVYGANKSFRIIWGRKFLSLQSNEASLAGVMGHELSHIVLGHFHNAGNQGAEEASADSLGIILARNAGYRVEDFAIFIKNNLAADTLPTTLKIENCMNDANKLKLMASRDTLHTYMQVEGYDLYCKDLANFLAQEKSRIQKLLPLCNGYANHPGETFIVLTADRFKKLREIWQR